MKHCPDQELLPFKTLQSTGTENERTNARGRKEINHRGRMENDLRGNLIETQKSIAEVTKNRKYLFGVSQCSVISSNNLASENIIAKPKDGMTIACLPKLVNQPMLMRQPNHVVRMLKMESRKPCWNHKIHQANIHHAPNLLLPVVH